MEKRGLKGYMKEFAKNHSTSVCALGLMALSLGIGVKILNAADAPDIPIAPGIAFENRSADQILQSALVEHGLVIAYPQSQETIHRRTDVDPIPSVPITEAGFQNEVTVAVSKENPNVIIASSNFAVRALPSGYPRDFDAVKYFSIDGGKTWKTSIVAGFPVDETDDSQGDPVMQQTADGFLLSGISFNRGGNGSGGVFVSRFASDGTAVDTQLVHASAPGKMDDKPWLAVDDHSGATLCWSQIGPRWEISCSTSDNSGATWGESFQIDTNSPSPYNIAAFPFYTSDGTLLISHYGLDLNTSLWVYREEPGGTFSKRKISEHPGLDAYQMGMMPEIIEDENGLSIYWGDGRNILSSRSSDKGGSWSSPEGFVVSTGENRWMKPFVASDPNNNTVVFAYYYEDTTHTLQLHSGMPAGEGMFPVGPKFAVVGGDIIDWDPNRQHMGDYNDASSNEDPGNPGVVAGFTVARPVESTPVGYVQGSDNDPHFAEVLTQPIADIADNQKLIALFRDAPAQTVTLNNQAITSGTFTTSIEHSTAGNKATICPTIDGVPGEIALPARSSSSFRVSAEFPTAPIPQRCNYTLSFLGPDGQKIKMPISAFLGGETQYLPQIHK